MHFRIIVKSSFVKFSNFVHCVIVLTKLLIANKPFRNMNIARPHFNTLDGIRGLAAILVIIFHAEQFFGGRPFPKSYLAVDVFFLLSGAVVANAYEHRLQSDVSVARFIWLRIVRIYPLYLVGTVFGIFAVIVAGTKLDAGLPLLLGSSALLLPSLETLILFPFNMPAWSLSVELLGNIAYAAMLKKLSDGVIIAIMALCAVAMAGVLWRTLRHSLDLGVMRIFFYVGYIRFGYSFLAGVLLYRGFMKYHGPAGARASSGYAWLVAAAVTAILMISPSDAIGPYYDFFAITIVLPFLIYWGMRFQAIGVSAKAFSMLGILSYPMYMLHDPLMTMAKYLSVEYTGQKIAAHAPYAGFGILLLVMALAWLANSYYDEPVRAWLTKILKRRSNARTVRV
jgi:peptidoglycan/LPS O-acetylase OafA/YrhL